METETETNCGDGCKMETNCRDGDKLGDGNKLKEETSWEMEMAARWRQAEGGNKLGDGDKWKGWKQAVGMEKSCGGDFTTFHYKSIFKHWGAK